MPISVFISESYKVRLAKRNCFDQAGAKTMNTLDVYISESPSLVCERSAEHRRLAPRPEAIIQQTTDTRSETRLWRLCRDAVSPGFSRIELGIFLFLGALASCAITGCFFDLVHFVGSNVLDHPIQSMITR